MRQRLGVLIPAFAAVAFLAAQGYAQAPTLEEQLSAQYKLVKMGSDSSGYSVVEEGTLLEVKKGGIIGVPYKNVSIRTATYQDGTVKASDAAGKVTKVTDKLCGVLHKCATPDTAKDETATKLFKAGDKVYPSKIEVQLDKDQVAMTIVACDTCNQTDPPTYNKAKVVFQFQKGALAKTAAADVEDTIGQLLAVSDTSQSAQGGDQQQGGQQQGGQQQQQQQSEPQSISMGMTPDQVQAAMGKPEKMVNLGPKLIYVYKDLKVTFINGRVADVQ